MTVLEIESVTAVPFGFPLRKPMGNARTAWSARSGLRVRIRAGRFEGSGEASPLPGFSRDSIAASKRDVAATAGALRAIATDEDPLVALGDATTGLPELGPSARFAVETALLDLLAQARGVPLWQLLAPSASPSNVPLNTMISALDTTEVLAQAEAAVARGIGCIKLKVGRRDALDAELAAAHALRGKLGPAFPLRLDANGAWSVEEAREALRAFSAVRPEFVEEPVSGAAWLELGATSVPVAIDETIAGEDGDRIVRGLLDKRACVAAVFKLTMLGGFLRASKLAENVRAARVDIIVTHAFEGPIGTAAAAAFAIAHANGHAAGLDIRAYAEGWVEDHPIGRDAVCPSRRTGLGIDPNAFSSTAASDAASRDG